MYCSSSTTFSDSPKVRLVLPSVYLCRADGAGIWQPVPKSRLFLVEFLPPSDTNLLSPPIWDRCKNVLRSSDYATHLRIELICPSPTNDSTTKKGSITSVQAVYVPADDLTDPAPATTFAHLDATTVLSRGIAELGIYPAVDPLDSKSRMLDPRVVGQEHYDIATNGPSLPYHLSRRFVLIGNRMTVQRILQDYKGLQDIIAILGMDELSEEDKLTVRFYSLRDSSTRKFDSYLFFCSEC